MRCSAWSSLAISVCSAVALLCAGPAGAHVDATPAFLEAGGAGLISLTAHNDRDVAMDGFAVTAPPELQIEDISALEGWEGSAEPTAATWTAGTAGSLPSGQAATFSVLVEAPPEPGTVSLRAEQRYPDGEVVTWPVALTVVPGDESSSRAYVWILLGGAGLLVLAGLALAWTRRSNAA
jgi:hypothetical protein